MGKQILFIQGGGEGAYEEDKRLVESLRHELDDEDEVRYPRMPEEEGSTYEDWKERLDKELSGLDEEVILAAHSIGGSVLLKYLIEEDVDVSIGGLFMIASPYFGVEGFVVDELTLADDFASKFPGDIPLFFYQSRDDEIVPLSHLAMYQEKLPSATFRAFSTGGHQFNNDLSEVAEDITKL